MRKILVLAPLAAIAVAATAWAETTPAVLTGPATAVSKSGAVLHATVNPGGGGTTYRFQYGPTVAYGAYSKAGHAGTGTRARPVLVGLKGLMPGTLYHYRALAGNKLGTTLGLDRTFTTKGHAPPGAITGVPSSVSTTTATLTGTVVTQGVTTTTYFEYGTTAGYGLRTSATIATAATTPTTVSFTLTGLAPGTTFHYRLVAVRHGLAPTYGADQAFTTVPLVPFKASVIAHTTPHRAAHKPYLFTTTGTVVPSVALPPGVGCTGTVRVRFFKGHKRVAQRKVPLQSNCTFAVQVKFRHLVNHAPARLKVAVRFLGNPYLGASGGRTRRVKLG